ncbi:MAG: HAD-IIIC family phosphatase [Holophaga sp.]|nr:HAD-IIIC family phosphatase [Holophaga sp.]
MLKQDRSGLNYFKLVKQARTPAPGGRPLRIALLSDASTQHLVPLLKVLFADNGVDAAIYEGGYDAIQMEAYNPDSGLYRFRPDLVFLINALGKVKADYYAFPDDPAGFAAHQAGILESIWNAIQEHGSAKLVQTTFVLPYERPFGHFGLKLPGTLHQAITELNREIAIRSRAHPNVLLLDTDALAGWVGRKHFIDERLWALAKSYCALECLPEVAQGLVDVALAAQGRSIKCVVLDLDNTLWGGVVGDDGLEGIGLGDLDDGDAFRFFQLYLRDLARRGIILAVCSKNNEETARRVFLEHPAMVLKLEHIAMFVANWEDKPKNLRRIQANLNIGFDSMVFLDDSPFERNMVRQLIPDLLVPELPEDPALYVRFLAELNLFETSTFSELDGKRNRLYQEQGRREQVKAHSQSIDQFLASLETEADIQPFLPRHLSRIAQLLQRSNQFNLTTRRLSEAECRKVMEQPARHPAFTITLRDTFGDFGLINVVLLTLQDATLEIDGFLMSCRVLQRGVEQLAMNRIFTLAGQLGATRVRGRYLPTAKNAMVKDFYPQFGFTMAATAEDGSTEWLLDVAAYRPRPVFIQERQP